MRWWEKGNAMNSRILSLRRAVVGVVTAGAVVVAGTGIQAHADPPRGTSEPVPVTGAEAASVAAALVRTRPDGLYASPEDEFTQLPVITAQGWYYYVPYERTYRGLPMIGGDFVVVVDPTGRVSTTSVALTHAVKDVQPGAAADPGGGSGKDRGRAREVAPRPGVNRRPAASWWCTRRATRLDWHGASTYPGRSISVDALTGGVLDLFESTPTDWTPPDTIPTCEQVDGSGTGYYNGPVSIVVEFCSYGVVELLFAGRSAVRPDMRIATDQ